MSLNSHYRRRLLARRIKEQGGRCCYCRRPFTKTGDTHPTVEHRKPRMDGGSDRVANLAAACLHCNQHRARQILRDRSRAARAAKLAPGNDRIET
ncbi:MAG TPA: HNH endonuclease [Allosphingosinicella sp.]|nr:HNH endonuclease [Allosphingosinicella sp.]